MANNEAEQRKMTTFVGKQWIDEWNQLHISIDLDMEKILEEKKQYQELFANNPNISSIETPASDPTEISMETWDQLCESELIDVGIGDQLQKYEGPKLEEHDEWRPRYASLEYRRGGSVVYRVGPKDLEMVCTFYIYWGTLEDVVRHT